MYSIVLYCVALLISTVSYAQEKISLNGFKWEAATDESDVIYGVGISSPGLPFDVAEKQAQKMVEIWIQSAVSPTINSSEFISYGEEAQKYGFNHLEVFGRSIELKSAFYDIDPEITKTIQFNDGSVCVILRATISSRPSLVNEQYVTFNYSVEETSNEDVSNYSMFYFVLVQKYDLYLKAEQFDDKVSVYPAKSIAKKNKLKLMQTTHQVGI